MLHLHRSNQAERLVQVLAQTLNERPLSDPMAAEWVVVHSQGMQRWLSQQLSQRLGVGPGAKGSMCGGICANVEYPFPARVVRRATAGWLDEDVDAPDPWAAERLVWLVLDLLPELLGDPALRPLATYLDNAPGGESEAVGRRRFALARRIAELFDRYVVYRPWMTAGWSRGEPRGPDPELELPADHRWQPIFWRAIHERLGRGPAYERFARKASGRSKLPSVVSGVPERVNFFGLGTLPPSYLRVIQALAMAHEVHMFLLCPSREYWGEIRSRRQVLAKTRDPAEIDAQLAIGGNPLLASFGRLARDFQLHLENHDGPDYSELEGQPFVDPVEVAGARDRPASMLEVVQSDILHLRSRGSQALSPVPIVAGDHSIQVHACHGLTRQVEVLREAILDLMNQDSTLEARDIVVMAPDIELFAPVVSAVFGEGNKTAHAPPSGEDGGASDRGARWGDAGGPALPFSIADRSLRETNVVAVALVHVLEMVGGRVEASTVLDLLRMAVVRDRFEISVEDLAHIEGWVTKSGVRWAIDAQGRSAHGQPEQAANTWRFGLDRLLLGVAMADEAQRSFGGVVPFDDMEGGGVARLGRFVEFCETLFEQLRLLGRPRTLGEWVTSLSRLLEDLVRVGEGGAWLVQQVRDVLERLPKEAGADEPSGAFAGGLELDALRSLLEGSFQVGRGAIGHQTGAITFCAMVPMRSIPHKVVCLLGMDDGAFPRAAPTLALDLMAAHPQVGDRSAREEDRFLFLEAILAARQNLLITYTGRDIRTNEALPPAVVIGQVLDVLDRSFESRVRGLRARDELTIQHPLQAFSPRNFRPAAPLSFDRRMLAGARRSVEDRQAPRAFFSEPLSEPQPAGEETRDALPVVELSDLVRFWRSPVAAIVRRLGISLYEDDELIEDREPMELDALERWKLGDALLRHRVEAHEGDWAENVPGRGSIPVGAPGQSAIEDATRQVETILQASEERRAGLPRTLTIDIELPTCRVVGAVDSIFEDNLIRVQFGTVRPRHRLEQWVRYLAANAQEPGVPWQAWTYGKGKARTLHPLQEKTREAHARLALQMLVDRYFEGQTEVLPFFPKTSYKYAAAIHRRQERRALGSARSEWHSDGGPIPGEDTDVFIVQAYGPDAAFEQVFGPAARKLASEIWDPILDAEARRK